MTVLIEIVLGVLLLNLLVTLVNALSAPLVANGPMPEEFPRVSVLVPARNEQENIRTCLRALQTQDYPDFDITVLDDQSSDATAEIVRQLADEDPRIHLITGTPLPAGWTGKNWACHQLSKETEADILLFTDADNWMSVDAIRKTVGWMQRLNLGLFSCFPQQITGTLGEKLVVPVFDLFVYSYLPLWLTYKTRFPSLAAANGQWIAFTKKAVNSSRCDRL